MIKVRSQETASIYTRNGVRLDADIYLTEAEGDFPLPLPSPLWRCSEQYLHGTAFHWLGEEISLPTVAFH